MTASIQHHMMTSRPRSAPSTTSGSDPGQRSHHGEVRLSATPLPAGRVNAAITQMLEGARLASMLWSEDGHKPPSYHTGTYHTPRRSIVGDAQSTGSFLNQFASSRAVSLGSGPRDRLLHRYADRTLDNTHLPRRTLSMRQKSELTSRRLKEHLVDEVADKLRLELGLLRLEDEPLHETSYDLSVHKALGVETETTPLDRPHEVPSEGDGAGGGGGGVGTEVLECDDTTGGRVGIGAGTGVVVRRLNTRREERGRAVNGGGVVTADGIRVGGRAGLSAEVEGGQQEASLPTDLTPDVSDLRDDPRRLVVTLDTHGGTVTQTGVDAEGGGLATCTTSTGGGTGGGVRVVGGSAAVNDYNSKTGTAAHDNYGRTPPLPRTAPPPPPRPNLLRRSPFPSSPASRGAAGDAGSRRARSRGDGENRAHHQRPASGDYYMNLSEHGGGPGSWPNGQHHTALTTETGPPSSVSGSTPPLIMLHSPLHHHQHPQRGSPHHQQGVAISGDSWSRTAEMIRDKRIPPMPSGPPPPPPRERFGSSSRNDEQLMIVGDPERTDDSGVWVEEVDNNNKEVQEVKNGINYDIMPDGVNPKHLPMLRNKRVFEKELAVRLEKKMEMEDQLLGDLALCMEKELVREKVESTIKVVKDVIRTNIRMDRNGNRVYTVLVDLGKFHRHMSHCVNGNVVEIQGMTFGDPETALTKEINIEFPETVMMERLEVKHVGPTMEMEVPFKPSELITNLVNLVNKLDQERVQDTSLVDDFSSTLSDQTLNFSDINDQEDVERPPELPMSPPPPSPLIKDPKPMRRRRKSGKLTSTGSDKSPLTACGTDVNGSMEHVTHKIEQNVNSLTNGRVSRESDEYGSFSRERGGEGRVSSESGGIHTVSKWSADDRMSKESGGHVAVCEENHVDGGGSTQNGGDDHISRESVEHGRVTTESGGDVIVSMESGGNGSWSSVGGDGSESSGEQLYQSLVGAFTTITKASDTQSVSSTTESTTSVDSQYGSEDMDSNPDEKLPVHTIQRCVKPNFFDTNEKTESKVEMDEGFVTIRHIPMQKKSVHPNFKMENVEQDINRPKTPPVLTSTPVQSPDDEGMVTEIIEVVSPVLSVKWSPAAVPEEPPLDAINPIMLVYPCVQSASLQVDHSTQSTQVAGRNRVIKVRKTSDGLLDIQRRTPINSDAKTSELNHGLSSGIVITDMPESHTEISVGSEHESCLTPGLSTLPVGVSEQGNSCVPTDNMGNRTGEDRVVIEEEITPTTMTRGLDAAVGGLFAPTQVEILTVARPTENVGTVTVDQLSEAVRNATETTCEGVTVEIGAVNGQDKHISGVVNLTEPTEVTIMPARVFDVYSESSALQYESTELQHDPTTLQSESAYLQPESTKFQSELTKLQSESTELYSDSTLLHSVSTELQPESTELQSEPTELQSESTDLQFALTELQSGLTILQSESTELYPDSTHLHSVSTELQSESTELKSEPTELQSEPIWLQSEPTALDSESNNLQCNSKKLQFQSTNMLSESTKFYSEPTELHSNIIKVYRKSPALHPKTMQMHLTEGHSASEKATNMTKVHKTPPKVHPKSAHTDQVCTRIQTASDDIKADHAFVQMQNLNSAAEVCPVTSQPQNATLESGIKNQTPKMHSNRRDSNTKQVYVTPSQPTIRIKDRQHSAHEISVKTSQVTKDDLDLSVNPPQTVHSDLRDPTSRQLYVKSWQPTGVMRVLKQTPAKVGPVGGLNVMSPTEGVHDSTQVSNKYFPNIPQSDGGVEIYVRPKRPTDRPNTSKQPDKECKTLGHDEHHDIRPTKELDVYHKHVATTDRDTTHLKEDPEVYVRPKRHKTCSEKSSSDVNISLKPNSAPSSLPKENPVGNAHVTSGAQSMVNETDERSRRRRERLLNKYAEERTDRLHPPANPSLASNTNGRKSDHTKSRRDQLLGSTMERLSDVEKSLPAPRKLRSALSEEMVPNEDLTVHSAYSSPSGNTWGASKEKQDRFIRGYPTGRMMSDSDDSHVKSAESTPQSKVKVIKKSGRHSSENRVCESDSARETSPVIIPRINVKSSGGTSSFSMRVSKSDDSSVKSPTSAIGDEHYKWPSEKQQQYSRVNDSSQTKESAMPTTKSTSKLSESGKHESLSDAKSRERIRELLRKYPMDRSAVESEDSSEKCVSQIQGDQREAEQGKENYHMTNKLDVNWSDSLKRSRAISENSQVKSGELSLEQRSKETWTEKRERLLRKYRSDRNIREFPEIGARTISDAQGNHDDKSLDKLRKYLHKYSKARKVSESEDVDLQSGGASATEGNTMGSSKDRSEMVHKKYSSDRKSDDFDSVSVTSVDATLSESVRDKSVARTKASIPRKYQSIKRGSESDNVDVKCTGSTIKETSSSRRYKYIDDASMKDTHSLLTGGAADKRTQTRTGDILRKTHSDSRGSEFNSASIRSVDSSPSDGAMSCSHKKKHAIKASVKTIESLLTECAGDRRTPIKTGDILRKSRSNSRGSESDSSIVRSVESSPRSAAKSGLCRKEHAVETSIDIADILFTEGVVDRRVPTRTGDILRVSKNDNRWSEFDSASVRGVDLSPSDSAIVHSHRKNRAVVTSSETTESLLTKGAQDRKTHKRTGDILRKKQSDSRRHESDNVSVRGVESYPRDRAVIGSDRKESTKTASLEPSLYDDHPKEKIRSLLRRYPSDKRDDDSAKLRELDRAKRYSLDGRRSLGQLEQGLKYKPRDRRSARPEVLGDSDKVVRLRKMFENLGK